MRYAEIVAAVAFALTSCSGGSPELESEPEAEFLDPLVADAEHYKLEFENDSVRVLRENLAAGEGGAMHSHRDRISVYLKDSEVVLTPRGGEPIEAAPRAGTTGWTDELTHTGVTKTEVENLSIELKELNGPEVPAPEMDAVAVDPEQHTVDFENDRVRVVRMIYPGNSTTTRHAHRAGFGVALTPLHVVNITDEGETEIEYAAGETFWTNGGSTHMTKNLGDEAIVVLLVELKKLPS